MSRDRDETTDQGPRVSVQPSGVSVSDPLMHNSAWTKSISDFNVIVKAEFQQRSGDRSWFIASLSHQVTKGKGIAPSMTLPYTSFGLK